MARQYVAFDIETAKDVPGEDFNWRPYRPLGIACAATLASDAEEPLLWYGKVPGGQPAERMSRDDAQRLVQHLGEMVANGYTILTWNGLGFDFDILAEESEVTEKCKQYARNHVDMMFQVVCTLGHPVALDKAAQGMGLAGKPEGMTGFKAPKLWAQAGYQEVLNYVAQDVRTTLQLAQVCEQRGTFVWITRKGVRKRMPLRNGWLTVSEALLLPEPDTSWMSNPPSRRDFTAWLR